MSKLKGQIYHIANGVSATAPEVLAGVAGLGLSGAALVGAAALSIPPEKQENCQKMGAAIYDGSRFGYLQWGWRSLSV